jgi:hypothetical protein
MTSLKKLTFLLLTIILLSSCNDDFSRIEKHQHPRWEFAPNMYHSEAYEPLTQITDSNAYGAEYNSNPYNPYRMNVREPVKGTIKRNTVGTLPFWTDTSRVVYLPYNVNKDSLALAARTLKNPLDSSAVVLKDGEILYKKFCVHCHGETGQGDGEVGKRLQGVPVYNSPLLRNVSGGHIFHVITHGKGRMGPHGSQLNQEERWKIVHYVQTLQKAQPTE